MINRVLDAIRELTTPSMLPEHTALVSHLDQCVDTLLEEEFNTLEVELESLRPIEERLRFAKRTYGRIG